MTTILDDVERMGQRVRYHHYLKSGGNLDFDQWLAETLEKECFGSAEAADRDLGRRTVEGEEAV